MFEYEGSRGEFLKLLAEFGEEPAFLRRASAVENSWSSLIKGCQLKRERLLKWPKEHLVNLRQRIRGDWTRVACFLPDPTEVVLVKRISSEWDECSRTSSARPWTDRSAFDAFMASAFRFNSSWRFFVEQLDLELVNGPRRLYNRYYEVERECAFGNTSHVRAFEPQPMVERDEIFRLFPLLELPMWPTA